MPVCKETRQETQTLRESFLIGIAQQGAVGTDGQWQLRIGDAEALDEVRGIRIRVGIEHGVRNRVAPQEVLQTQRFWSVARPKQH